MNHLLFLCTGNVYRSRFAELYFRHLAAQQDLDWAVDSRGLLIDDVDLVTGGLGATMSERAMFECRRLGVPVESPRAPRPLREFDLEAADLIIAVKEEEHRPMLRWRFPAWEDRVQYWNVHDLDVAPATEALPHLRCLVEALVLELCANRQ